MLAVTGGMAASFALPASAATEATVEVKANAPVASVAIVARSAAPASLAASTYGKIGFKGVVAAREVAALVIQQRPTSGVSRSATRQSILPVSTKTQKTIAPSSGGLLDVAASLAGIDYVYGGSTTAGFDCSGFTQYVFGKRGISLPRTSEAQQQAATPVSDPQPGDLVFIGSPAHHVGIYAGNGMMWDSPHTGMAVSKRAIYSSGATYGRF